MANRTIINNTAPDANTGTVDNSAHAAWATAIIVVVAFLLVAFLYFARVSNNALPGVPNTSVEVNTTPETATAPSGNTSPEPNNTNSTNVIVPIPSGNSDQGTSTN